MSAEIDSTPQELAAELIARHRGDHQAAEREAWKLRDAHGRETPTGRLLTRAACEIADQYHNVPWKDDAYTGAHRVPVFNGVQKPERG